MKTRAPINQELDLATFAFDALAKACLVAAFLLLLPIGALTVAEFVFGYHSYPLETREMEPALAPGTLVISHPVAASDLTVGDVVAFHPPDMPSEVATRRVSKLAFGPPNNQELIYTRADSASTDDAWVIPGSATVDREVLTIPAVGAPAAALQSTTARLLFLVLPALLLVLVLLTQLVRRSLTRPVIARTA